MRRYVGRGGSFSVTQGDVGGCWVRRFVRPSLWWGFILSVCLSVILLRQKWPVSLETLETIRQQSAMSRRRELRPHCGGEGAGMSEFQDSAHVGDHESMASSTSCDPQAALDSQGILPTEPGITTRGRSSRRPVAAGWQPPPPRGGRKQGPTRKSERRFCRKPRPARDKGSIEVMLEVIPGQDKTF